ncbi:class A beta-lactamase [Phaeobacter sp. C3_T13_0]|uniref:class A beta-lactamase n=1 Tax=Phaeobacter cretensis TaxID=3342641 RepID=UPI0039BC9478
MLLFHRHPKCIASAGAIAIALLLATQALAEDLTSTVRAWQDRLDARIGVLLIHPASGWEIAHDADSRFPLNSTFKPLLCATILSRVDQGLEQLSAQVDIRKKDLVGFSNVTKHHIDAQLNVGQLCDAAITRSDNTATNLLLERLGGPQEFTGYMQQIGDQTTRLDRWETDLNTGTPGDPRDTTTPRSILSSLNKALFGTLLTDTSSAQLADWMERDQLADDLIRAHLPKGWRIGDKTGAGAQGSRGLIAFLQDTQGEQYLAAIYITETTVELSDRNQAISDIGRVMIDEIKARK